MVGLQGRMEESEEVQELYNRFLTHSERERASEGRGPMFYMKPTAEGEIRGRDRRRFRLVNGRSRCSFSVDARINEACWKEKKTLTFKDP